MLLIPRWSRSTRGTPEGVDKGGFSLPEQSVRAVAVLFLCLSWGYLGGKAQEAGSLSELLELGFLLCLNFHLSIVPTGSANITELLG